MYIATRRARLEAREAGFLVTYKKQILRLVKILYFCLGWVEILMTPLKRIYRLNKLSYQTLLLDSSESEQPY